MNETWLSPETTSDVLKLKDYSIYRNDRKTRGGGVLIAVNEVLKSELVNINPQYEMLTVDILRNTSNAFRLITVYNPPSNDATSLKSICSELESMINKACHCVIIGDLNLPKFDWENSIKNVNNPNSIFQRFLDLSQPIHQMLKSPTRGDSILDIILTNSPESISGIQEHPPISSSDHVLISGSIVLSRFARSTTNHVYRYDFHTADEQKINDFLSSKLPSLHSCKNIEEYWNNFIKIINNSIELFVPYTKLNIKKTRLPFHFFKLYRKVRRAYNKFKRFKKNFLKEKYSKLKSTFKNSIRNYRNKTEKQLISKGNSCGLFKYLKSNRCVPTISSITLDHGAILNDPRAIAEAFNEYFISTFDINDGIRRERVQNTKDIIIISESNLRNSIKHLRNSKGFGTDRIPMEYWNKFETLITKTVVKMFNMMANSAFIPNDWKINSI